MSIILEQQKALERYTKEQWAKWYAHKSNKERWIEAKEANEEAEIDEGGEELDEEKIADAIDTEDLGAKADYAYQAEKDERAMS